MQICGYPRGWKWGRPWTALAIALMVMSLTAVASAEPLRLSLEDACTRALHDGAAARLARTRQLRTEVARREALGGLFPQADARVFQYSESINLETFGFALPGQPPIIGPFDVTDAQITAAMQVFNLAALRHFQATRSGAEAGRSELQATVNDLVAAVAKLYVLAKTADTEVRSRQAEVALFEKLLQVAEDELEAGTGTKLDVAQAKVRVASVKQALLAAENARENTRLALLDAIGQDVGTDFVLTDELAPPGDVPPLDSLIATARARRPELKAAALRVREAELTVSATKSRLLPSVQFDVQADESGNYADSLLWSRRVGAMVSVPIFHTQLRAKIAQAKLALLDARTNSQEAARMVEQDVRKSRMALETAKARVEVATEGASVADQALQIARDRRASGYGSTVEVDRAQEAWQQAHENLIAAHAEAALALYSLKHATGEIGDMVGSAK